MDISTVLFDFDGTVYDTVEGITKSVQYALRKHGLDADPADLRCFAGPPLVDQFMEVYGFDRQEAEQLVLDFRERYGPTGVYESRPFPGIRECLLRLRAAGLTTGIASSKPQTLIEFLLKGSGLADCFDVVAGSGPAIRDQEKWKIVERAMEACGASRDRTVLIGDTKYDVAGALRCGIPCIGVAWGYAAEGELEAAGAAAIASDMDDLIRMLTGPEALL